jgi:fructose-bisphosphate aldolase class II
MAFQAEYVAVSFPKNATDMEMARQLANVAGEARATSPGHDRQDRAQRGHPAARAILKASDGIMVARGDLAVEVGNAAVPALQKRMIRMARELDKVAITATQMMESMIQNPVPTRAEVSDVANAVLDGTDAVMLSAETAAGKYPVETVEQMAQIALEAERADEVKLDTDFTNKQFGRIDQSIAMGALFTAYHLGCKAIIALTESGSTALWMSRYNIKVPIYGLTTQVVSQRKMALYRNVRPILMPSRPTATRRWCRGRETAGRTRRAQARRHLRHHLRRAHGLPRRHQHAQGLPGRLNQLQGHGRALEAIAPPVGAVGAQHVVERAWGVQRDRQIDGGALAPDRPVAEPAAPAEAAILERGAVGMHVHHIGQPGRKEQAAAGVPFGVAGELALGQFEHRQFGVVDVEALTDALEQAAAVVRDQQLHMHRRLPHRHRDAAAAAVVDGVVQQLGECMLCQPGHLQGQVEARREVARPGAVLLQARQVVALHDLAQRTRPVDLGARLPQAAHPAGSLELAQQRTCASLADLQAIGQIGLEVGSMVLCGGGDPGGDGGDLDSGHGETSGGARNAPSSRECPVAVFLPKVKKRAIRRPVQGHDGSKAAAGARWRGSAGLTWAHRRHVPAAPRQDPASSPRNPLETSMPLVAMRPLLDRAAERGYGIPAFNVNNLEQVQAAMSAAAEVGAPVILQASAGARKYAGEPFIKHLIQAAVESWPKVPLAMHQDHGQSPEICKGAIDLGFTSVMMDGSLEADGKTIASYEYNVEVTRKVVEMAHAVGVTVEGELGCLGSLETMRGDKEDGHGTEATMTREQLLTDPEQAADFVARTGVDALAIAIGTSHGAYKFSRKPTGDILAIDRIMEIHRRLPNTHLVMHGSSSVPQDLLEIIRRHGGDMKETYGVPVEEIQRAIKHGVRKINIDTDIRLAMTGAIRKYMAENPSKFDPRDYLKPAREAAKQICRQRYVEFGCEGMGV